MEIQSTIVLRNHGSSYFFRNSQKCPKLATFFLGGGEIIALVTRNYSKVLKNPSGAVARTRNYGFHQ